MGILGAIWKFGKWRKVKVDDCEVKWGIQNDNFGYGDTIRNTLARIVNVLSRCEMGEIPVVGIARCWENASSGGRSRNYAKWVGGFGKSENCGKFRRGEENTPNFKRRKKRGSKKELNSRIKKLKREIEKSDFKGPIIDRSRTPDGVNTQIDVSAGGFRN